MQSARRDEFVYLQFDGGARMLSLRANVDFLDEAQVKMSRSAARKHFAEQQAEKAKALREILA